MCREVLGYDTGGRLRLSPDFKCEGAPTANARLECRSCWRTFPVPEGTPRTAAPEETPTRPATQATGGVEMATETSGQGLTSVLRRVVEEAQSATVLRITKLEVSLASLAHALEDVPSLRAEVAALRDQSAAVTAAHPPTPPAESKPTPAAPGIVEQVAQLRETIVRQSAEAKERADALDAAHREAAQARGWLGEVIAQLEVGEQATRQRLEAQADAIRGLHAAGQEQASRMEELRAAVQRLEDIVSRLNRVNSPPEGV